jgi:hypothetical protein
MTQRQFCIFGEPVSEASGVYTLRCEVCEKEFQCSRPKLVKVCTANALPPLFQRLKNFTVAAIAHVAAGSPTCDQATIDARLAICRGCEHFIRDPDNPQLGACSQCGCTVGREQKFLSKLAWADQACPVGKWPAVAAE